MKEMTEDFVPRLNQFTELLKAAYQLHAKQIKQLGAWQTQLQGENKKLQEQLKKQYDEQQYKNANAANTVAKGAKASGGFLVDRLTRITSKGVSAVGGFAVGFKFG